ncbi:MAG: hypothetical protein P1U36_03985 [Legionellaceae bacterium]|nr:hypothetical protein [Legionellaceae bacterium]
MRAMYTLLRFILLILASAYVNTALATAHATEVFPAACKAFTIQGENLTIPADNPRVLMIHNLSAFDVWITHPASDADFDAGWSSRLQGNQWSALALDKTKIKLNCVESKPGHEQQVSCGQALAACEWPITSRPKHTHGIFWAGENMELTALTAYIGRHGFELPSQAQ